MCLDEGRVTEKVSKIHKCKGQGNIPLEIFET